MYATRDDLAARYEMAEIDALAADPDAPAADRVAARLADAAGEIDAVLAQAYALPLPAGTWPALTRIQCDIARALLYDDATLEAPTRLRDQSTQLLRSIRDGKSMLVSAAGVVAPRRHVARFVDAGDDMTRDQVERL